MPHRHALVVPLLLVTAVLAAEVTVTATGDIGYDIPETTMPFSFKSRKYGGTKLVSYHLPNPCLSFIRLQGGEDRRPLYVTGHGRYGYLLLTLGCEPMAEFFDYELTADVDGVIVYDTYGVSGIGDLDRYSAGSLLETRPPLRLHITGLGALDEDGERLRRFLRFRRAPTEEEEPPGVVHLRARLDAILSRGEHRIALEELPVTIELSFRLNPIPYRTPCPYWQLVFRSEKIAVQGTDLGLTGPDAGELDLTLSGGALAPIADPVKVTSEALEDSMKAIDRIRDRMRGGGTDDFGEELE